MTRTIIALAGFLAGLLLGLVVQTAHPQIEPAAPSAPVSRDPAGPWPGP